MAKVKKYKKLTAAQKKIRKEVKEELRADGMLPPIKPRLNRKKFAQEVKAEYRENIGSYNDVIYIHEAISWSMPSCSIEKITPEQIGVLKMLKIALELKKFHEEKREKGETTYNAMDVYKDIVLPIKEM